MLFVRLQKNKKTHRRTPHSRQPAAKSPHTKAQRRRVGVAKAKKNRSSIKRKEVIKKIHNIKY
jgi:hypothetical protein